MLSRRATLLISHRTLCGFAHTRGCRPTSATVAADLCKPRTAFVGGATGQRAGDVVREARAGRGHRASPMPNHAAGSGSRAAAVSLLHGARKVYPLRACTTANALVLRALAAGATRGDSRSGRTGMLHPNVADAPAALPGQLPHTPRGRRASVAPRPARARTQHGCTHAQRTHARTRTQIHTPARPHGHTYDTDTHRHADTQTTVFTHAHKNTRAHARARAHTSSFYLLHESMLTFVIAARDP